MPSPSTRVDSHDRLRTRDKRRSSEVDRDDVLTLGTGRLDITSTMQGRALSSPVTLGQR